MKKSIWLFALLGTASLAQTVEVGAQAGYSYARDLDVKTLTGSPARVGMKAGYVVNGFLLHNLHEHVSGEIRYTYRRGDMKITSGGAEAGFAAQTHAVGYDLLLFPNGREAPVRPFAAVGGGARWFVGTGLEQPVQPLSEFALFTHTRELKGMASLGGGVMFRLSRRAIFRVDFRDLLTPFPKEVVAPPPGAQFGGWLHDLTMTAGFGVGF